MYTDKQVLSIVVPLYKGECFLDKLVWELESFALNNQNIISLEIIFVDDGSPDQTFEALKKISPQNFTWKAIRLSRNFKSYIAILAGIQESSGYYITFLPQDLQESPEVTAALLAEIKSGYDVVWAVRGSRSDPWLEKLLSKCFHKLMHQIWSSWPQTGADVFMITKPIADILLNIQEKNSHITGQILWMGFRQTHIFYNRSSRKIGKSGWTTFNKIKLAIDIITQFSYAPIKICSILGVTIATLGFLYGIFILINKLFFGVNVEGWASVMLVILLIGGMQMIFLGVIGEYLWRTFDEVRKRPTYIVMDRIN
ncbi:MAG: glycosyltransferase family 2 protein [Methylacidiphilales bacterium]|nr:glycosyltransferase family 2 protein [Candidatus Methylacidiphilales bacterium]NJR15837.1 glycosyltransferase family 2 protein [Calothrix sp. CSU_2_0]